MFDVPTSGLPTTRSVSLVYSDRLTDNASSYGNRERSNPDNLAATRLVKSGAAQQVRKAWITAHRIKEGMYLEELQND